MNNIKFVVSLLLFLLIVLGLGADSSAFRFFSIPPLLKNYTTDTRNTAGHLEVQMENKKPPQYPWHKEYTAMPRVEIRLGLDLPLLGGDIDNFSWRWGFPIAATTLNDFFRAESAPVINTDYWFGVRLDLLYRLNIAWPKNVALRLIPVFHESTHIGDEFALEMRDTNPESYHRVNVSYEAWEVMFGLSEITSDSGNNFNARIGLGSLWSNAYYDALQTYEKGPNTSKMHLNRLKWEFMGQINVQITSGFPAFGKLAFVSSLGIRNRILFHYFSNKPEKRIWNLSSSMGWRIDIDSRLLDTMEFYIRYMYGQNPHGQFRDQDAYSVFGIGVALGFFG